jgi:PIN domain nuclease of toxin-antitoxin system
VVLVGRSPNECEGDGALPIIDEHIAGLIDMPYHHKDPFDRMLISQANFENIPIVSADVQLDSYGITRLW